MQPQLSVSFKVFTTQLASPEYHIIANYLVSTLSYVASYLCTVSIVSSFLALADIKAFSHMYSQITAASDWPHLSFHPKCFYLAYITSFCHI